MELNYVCGRSDGSTLAVGTFDGRLLIVRLDEGRYVEVAKLADPISRIRWTADGTTLLVGTMGGHVQVRSADGGVLHDLVDTKHGSIRGLVVHADGRFLTCGRDGSARLWKLGGARPLLETAVPTSERGTIEASSCELVSGAIVVGYTDGWFEAHDETNLELKARGQVLPNEVYAMGANAARDALVMGGDRGSMRAMVTRGKDEWWSGRFWHDPPKPIAVNSIAFDASGAFVAAFSDGSAKLYGSIDDAVGTTLGEPFYMRSPRPEWSREMIVSAACFLGDSGLVVSSHWDGYLRLWKRERHAEVLLVDGHLEVHHDRRTIQDRAEIGRWWKTFTAE